MIYQFMSVRNKYKQLLQSYCYRSITSTVIIGTGNYPNNHVSFMIPMMKTLCRSSSSPSSYGKTTSTTSTTGTPSSSTTNKYDKNKFDSNKDSILNNTIPSTLPPIPIAKISTKISFEDHYKFIETKYRVPEENHDMRLDKFMRFQTKLQPSMIHMRIRKNEIFYDANASLNASEKQLMTSKKKKAKPHGKVCAGDTIIMRVRKRANSQELEKNSHLMVKKKDSFKDLKKMALEKLKSSIIYKDERIIVFNKPSEVKNQVKNKQNFTVAGEKNIPIERLLDVLKSSETREEQETKSNKDDYEIVNPLDYESSGILIVARKNHIAKKLKKQFIEKKDIETDFYAVVLKCLPIIEETLDTGIQVVTLPTRQTSKITKFHASITPDQLKGNNWEIFQALTKYKVIAIKRNCSLLKLNPITDIRHQIRLHCGKVLGTPILGDYKYGPGRPYKGFNPYKRNEIIPLHLHLHQVVIKDWFGKDYPLKLQAKFPDHFVKTMTLWGLKMDQVEQMEQELEKQLASLPRSSQ